MHEFLISSELIGIEESLAHIDHGVFTVHYNYSRISQWKFTASLFYWSWLKVIFTAVFFIKSCIFLLKNLNFCFRNCVKFTWETENWIENWNWWKNFISIHLYKVISTILEDDASKTRQCRLAKRSSQSQSVKLVIWNKTFKSFSPQQFLRRSLRTRSRWKASTTIRSHRFTRRQWKRVRQ